MSNTKDLRLFIAEDIAAKSGILDLDLGFLLAEVLWEDAMVYRDVRAIEELKDYIHRWSKGV